MNGIQWSIIINVARKFALPALFGAAVVWLIHHNMQPWADVLCAVSDAILVTVEECK